MKDYPDKSVTLEVLHWKPIELCNEGVIDVYGTNGSLHAVPEFPIAELNFREGRHGFEAGTTKKKTDLLHGTSNVPSCNQKPSRVCLPGWARVRGAKESDLKQGCCGLENNVKIVKAIAARYKSSSSRQWMDVEVGLGKNICKAFERTGLRVQAFGAPFHRARR
jgi:hypothetical protein